VGRRQIASAGVWPTISTDLDAKMARTSKYTVTGAVSVPAAMTYAVLLGPIGSYSV